MKEPTTTDDRIAWLESRMATMESNFIAIVTTPKVLTFAQEYAPVLIFVGTLFGMSAGLLVGLSAR